MNRRGSALLVALIVLLIAIVCAAGAQIWSVHKADSTPTELGTFSASSQTTNHALNQVVRIPATATQYVSPDKAWIAFLNGNIANNMPMDTTTTGELVIVSRDGSKTINILPAQFRVTPKCDCRVGEGDVFGWENDNLWLRNEFDGPYGSPMHYFVVHVPSGSVTENVPKFIGLPLITTFRNGKLVTDDFPFGPMLFQSFYASDTVLSMYVYAMENGTSQLIQTTTFAVAYQAYEGGIGFTPKWIDDNTLQYYKFSTGLTATTSIR